MTDRTYTIVEISEALGLVRSSAAERAAKEFWPYQEESVRGGKKRLYLLSTLPREVQTRLQAVQGATNPTAAQRAMQNVCAMLNKAKEDQAAAEVARQAKAEAALKELAGGLSENEALSLKAHFEVAQGWKVWFGKAGKLAKSASWKVFEAAYNKGEITVSQAVRSAYPSISARSVQRWVWSYEKEEFDALIDRRNGSKRRDKDIFHATPLLAAAAVKIMMDKPGIGTTDLHQMLKTASIDHDSGEVLFQEPSIHQVYRFQKKWQKNNQELYTKATNPDAWKNTYMLALGSYSENVTALNQMWEMDATPADWLLLDDDGKRRRYTVSVIIDVWSRRIIVVMAPTPKSVTHCYALRLALLAWGVPKKIVTDNGQDYQSEHFKRVLMSLGIEHFSTNPFSPEEKPHVERVIKTLNHSILELLPNFAGHSVADRKAIEARKAFSSRLFGKGEVIESNISGEAMQALINQWVSGSYEQNEHGTLGMTPFAKAASWTGEVRRIGDERALDILLSPPANGGTRTLQKKGLQIDGAWFIAPEFGDIDVGSEVNISETEDLGRIIVYYRKNFLCVAENATRKGVNRQEIAAIASARQKKRLAEGRKEIREATKGRIDTDSLVVQHLTDRAESAGKLTTHAFGAKQHQSHGLEQAALAKEALKGIQPSDQSETLSQEALAVFEKSNQVVMHPNAAQNVSIVAGMTAEERYEYWLKLDRKNTEEGDLEDTEQRRWHKVFSRSTTWRAQKSMRENKMGEMGK